MFKKIGALAVSAYLALVPIAAFGQANSSNYQAQGGADWEVGGTLNVKAGGTFSFGNVAQTGAIKVGEVALGGSNPTTVTTGFGTSISGCSLTIKESSAPGIATTTMTYTTSGGTLSVYAWKPTSSGNPTLVASTGTETFGWVCTGV